MKRIIAIVLVEILFIGGGLFIIFHSNVIKLRCTEKTTGTIVSFYESHDNVEVSTTTYYPIVQYKVGDKTLTHQSRTELYSKKGIKEGATIKILYNPNNVEEFILEGYELGGSGIVMVQFGVILLIVITILTIRQKKRNKS